MKTRPYIPREDDPYPNLREVLAPEYAALPPEQIEILVERTFGSAIHAEDYESIFGDIGRAASSVGSAIGNVAKQAAPVLGSALSGAASGAMAGSALGPWGMLGGALIGGTASALQAHGKGPARDIGNVLNTGMNIAGSIRGGGGAGGALGGLGSMLGGGGRGAGGGAGALGGLGNIFTTMAAPALGRAMPGAGGSPAAGQLLNLLGRPEIMQGLMAMMMGPMGRRNVQVGSTPVPVGAITNLLGSLANQASVECHAAHPTVGEAVPEYLTNGAEFRCDIASPEARAAVLWELLQENDPFPESDESDEAIAESDPDGEVEDFYDSLEAAEIAEFEEEEWA